MKTLNEKVFHRDEEVRSQMKIPEEIYTAHQNLSNCSAKFLDFVKNNPGSFIRSNYNDLFSQPGYEYLQPQPWPTFINKQTKKEITDAAVKVCQLIKSIPDRIFSYDFKKIADYFAVPEHVVDWLFTGVDNDHINHLLGRGDFIFSRSGGLKSIEFNMQSGLGGWELDVLEQMYSNTPIIARFLKEYQVKLQKSNFFRYFLEYLNQRALERFPTDSNSEVNIAFVFPTYTEEKNTNWQNWLNQLHNRILLHQNPTLKGEVLFCDFKQLKVAEGFAVLKNKRIHTLVELCSGDVPFRFVNIFKTGNLLLYNGPVSRFMSNKFNLALLSQYQDSDMFTAEEKEVIRAYIPWTRKLIPGETTFGTEKIKLEDFVISNREQLVLKPSFGFGGQEVHLGRNYSENQWKELIKEALLKKDQVVQEYIQPASYLYQNGENSVTPHHAVWGFFLFGSRYAGGFVRILPEKNDKGVINSRQGAEESPILEVEE